MSLIAVPRRAVPCHAPRRSPFAGERESFSRALCVCALLYHHVDARTAPYDWCPAVSQQRGPEDVLLAALYYFASACVEWAGLALALALGVRLHAWTECKQSRPHARSTLGRRLWQCRSSRQRPGTYAWPTVRGKGGTGWIGGVGAGQGQSGPRGKRTQERERERAQRRQTSGHQRHPTLQSRHGTARHGAGSSVPSAGLFG